MWAGTEGRLASMNRILVFCTAADKYVNRILTEKNNRYNKISLVVTKDRERKFRELFSDIELITTSSNHIGYENMKDLMITRSRRWDEVWLLSSGVDNYWEFVDSLCIISEIKYKKLYFIDSQNHITEKNIGNRFFIDAVSNIVTQIWFYLCVLINDMKSGIRGYRW